MTLAEDLISELPIFFDRDEFAVEAEKADGSKINVIFDLNPEQTLMVENAEIQVTGRYSDFEGLVHEDTLTIGGVVYKVKPTPRDEGGISILRLSRD